MPAMKTVSYEKCGNVIILAEDSFMSSEQRRGIETSYEMHVPLVMQDEKHVTVYAGSKPHPMLEDHCIEWIVLLTQREAQIRFLQPSQAARAEFDLTDYDSVIAAYAMCSVHGLWRVDVKGE